MAEVALWKWLKLRLPQGHYSRVESPDTSPGIPDVNYRIPAAEGWIELKDNRSKRPLIPFPNEDKGLRKTQVPWISQHVCFGAIVWICARVGDQIFWVPGKYAGAFNGSTMKRLKALSAYVHGANPDIRRLRELLEGEGQ